MVCQNCALCPYMTVYDNMAFSLKLAGESREETRVRVEEAAMILGLEEYLRRYPRQLSGGQRQRVAMGRAIVRKPEVFLFDEPLSNLDAKLRVAMRAEIPEGREVVVGVRPEHFAVTDDGVPAEVVVVEPTGADTQIFCKLAGVAVTAVVRERHTFQPGAAVRLKPQLTYLFDPSSGA